MRGYDDETHAQTVRKDFGGMKVSEIPTHPQSGVELSALDLATQQAGAAKALLLVRSFWNSLGSLMPDARKAQLADPCEQHHILMKEAQPVHLGAVP